MSRYDDDQVIALLRSSVPAPPDAPDRMAAVRRKAGHQRAAVWTQTLGAVASVVLILGFAAVATGGTGGGRGRVEPVSRPLEALTTAFGKARSVQFAASMEPAGDVGPAPDAGLSERQVRDMLTGRVTGAATSEGDLRVDGDLSILLAPMTTGHSLAAPETHLRFVDGASYRSVSPLDQAPRGKNWVREDGDSSTSAADLDRSLRMLAAVAEDVEYVRQSTVRGIPVAEYRLTVPKRWAHQELKVTFALDADDRLRRVATAFSWATLLSGGELPSSDGSRVRVELELFGYDSAVDIEAPPAAEVIAAADLEEGRREAMTRCLNEAKDGNAHDACYQKHLGYDSVETGPEGESFDMEGCQTSYGPDGSITRRCDDDGSTGWTGYPGASPAPTAATASPSP